MAWRDWMLFSLFSVAVATGIVAIGLAPRSGDQVAVIVSPWQSASAALVVVAAADGRFVRSGFADWVVVASSSRPDFVSRLYSAGAWTVADPTAAGACLVEQRVF
ncbi:hypothetical protein [Breoghania sp.]|uniref:hypothetical protein n=1 Tax=Breoghania sp. TaxID=2065378 RepID=UPI0026218BFB|nr:hypothetical protein [Breoghania sp.]MDJ0932858.1 hypothetical protein [Breoghania sp.]